MVQHDRSPDIQLRQSFMIAGSLTLVLGLLNLTLASLYNASIWLVAWGGFMMVSGWLITCMAVDPKPWSKTLLSGWKISLIGGSMAFTTFIHLVPKDVLEKYPTGRVLVLTIFYVVAGHLTSGFLTGLFSRWGARIRRLKE